jgi:valyl-tRNA synthetase
MSLRLLHPIMPFIMEEIWEALPNSKPSKLIATAPYPEAEAPEQTTREEEIVSVLIDAITAVRNIRGEHEIAPSKKIEVGLHVDESTEKILATERVQIERLVNAAVTFQRAGSPKPEQAAASIVNKVEAVVPLHAFMDWAKEHEKTSRAIAKLKVDLDKTDNKLKNPAFTDKAPADVVAKERQKADEMRAELAKLESILAHAAKNLKPA